MKCKIGPGDEWKCEGETQNASGVCDGCIAGGWITDPTEIAKALEQDGGFQVGVQSPIQRHDL
jgi:hypothetical protein